MRRLLFSAAFLALLAGVAFAADVQAVPANQPFAKQALVPLPAARQFSIRHAPSGQTVPGPLRMLPWKGGPIQVQPPLATIDRNGLLRLTGDTCFKLRKYVFEREDGSDRMKYVGETDCTSAGKVTSKSAHDPDPRPGGFGVYKAVQH